LKDQYQNQVGERKEKKNIHKCQIDHNYATRITISWRGHGGVSVDVLEVRF
jgi:hypothetical protein